MQPRRLGLAGLLACSAWGCAPTTTATARPERAGAAAEGEDAAVSVTVDDAGTQAEASDEDGAAKATVETSAADHAQPED